MRKAFYIVYGKVTINSRVLLYSFLNGRLRPKKGNRQKITVVNEYSSIFTLNMLHPYSNFPLALIVLCPPAPLLFHLSLYSKLE